MEKINKELLEKFKQARTNIFDVKIHLAEISLTEENVRLEKAKTIEQYTAAQKEMNDVNSEIIEKYGAVKINPITGEIHDNSDNSKVSVGPDYKNAMHFTVGQEVIKGRGLIENIIKDPFGNHIDIYIKSSGELHLWKTINSTIPVLIEYDIEL